MKKLVQFAAWTLAGILVIVVAIAAYIAATFDPNQYKPQIVRAVKDKTQRVLKLEGDIKLSLFPGIGATLGKISLSEFGNDREFAGIEDFRISLKLLPLLSKQLVVDSIEIKNLRANLIRGKDGKFSIDDLTGGGDKPAPAVKPSGPPVMIEIDHVTLENATITYIDQAAGAKYTLFKLNVKTGRIASGVPSTINLSFTAQSDKPRLDLQSSLKTTVTFDFDKRSYALDGLDFSTKGIAAGISNLAATARGDVDAKLATGEFLISKFAVVATGKQEGRDLNVRFDVPRLVVTRDKVSGEKIVLDAIISEGKSKITAKLDIPGIDGNAQSFKAGEMTAGINMQQEGATIKTRLRSPLAGSIEAKWVEFAKLVATVNVSNPKLPKNPIDATINGSALVDLAKQNASMLFVAKFDDSTIRGKAGLAKFAPPQYAFDLDIDQLDADRYLPKSDPKQKHPLDLSALKGLTANGSLKFGTLKVADVTASNVRVDVKAND
jgi:AsmA protein